jgi:hypothetical protein
MRSASFDDPTPDVRPKIVETTALRPPTLRGMTFLLPNI